MPPIDRPGLPNQRRRRPRRTPAPRPPAPSVQRQQSLAVERSYGSQGRQVQHAATRQQRAARVVHPRGGGTGAFAPPTTQQPFQRQQRQAQRKVNRARAKLPDHPAIPRIPVLPGYTPHQILAIHDAYSHGARQAGVRSVNQLFDLGSARQQRNMLAVSRAVERSPVVQANLFRARDTVKAAPKQSGLSKGLATIGDEAISRLAIPGAMKANGTQKTVVDLLKSAGRYGVEAPASTVYNLGRVTVEHPVAVGKSSVRTAVESIAGIPEGVKAFVDNPHEAIKAIAEDYERRYGSILSDPAKFRRQVQQDYGLTPFVLDAAGFGATVGKGAGLVARSTAFDRAVAVLSRTPGLRKAGYAGQAVRRVATDERPLLREFAGEGGAKAQDVSRNLFVAGGQRALDRARGARYRRMVNRAGLEEMPGGRLRRVGEQTPSRLQALRPGEGEVIRLPNVRDLPLLRRYTGHAARDIGAAQSKQRLRLLTHRGRTLQEINRRLRKLPADQQKALKYMLELGVKPDENGIRALRRRLAQMTRARKESGRDVAPILGDTNDEVRLLRTILKEPEKYLTPHARQVADDLKAIQLREAAKDPTLAPEQELIQRYTKQADLLGVPRRLPSAEEAIVQSDLAGLRAERGVARGAVTRLERQARENPEMQAGPLVEARDNLARIEEKVNGTQRQGKLAVARGSAKAEVVDNAEKFAERTRKAAEEAGLEDPAYFMSSARPEDQPSLAAVGKGMRAAHQNRKYTGALHEIGAEEHGVDVYTKGVERNIKRRFQHALVARNLETHAFEWSRGKGNAGMTVSEIKRELDRRMIDPSSVQLVDTNILTRREDIQAGLERGSVLSGEEDPFSAETANLREHLRDMPENLSNDEIQRLAQMRFVVVPKEVGEAVNGAASALDSKAMRAIENVLKNKPARILLGAANIPWLSIQVASNALLTGLGGMPNPLDVYGAAKWFRGLDPEARNAVEAELGITHGHHFAMDQPNLGASTNRIVGFWRGYKASKVGRIAHQMNPLDAMFRADEAQNNFFRRTLFYSKARRAAYRQMGNDWRQIDKGISRLVDRVLARPPENMAHAIATNGPEFEKVAKSVKDFLGNYTEFTPSERFLLSRNVMFYGYLRFSLRFAFYTMPVQHPIMAAILGDVGRLGAQEIKDLFGVPSNYRLPTNMLANVYFGDRKDAKQGTLRSLNIGRMNPFLNSVTQLQSGEQAVGLVSPLMQDLADQLFQESSFTGQDWKILGETPPDLSSRPSNYYGSIFGALIPGRPRNRILARNLLEMATPYRIAEKTGIPNVNLPLIGHVPGTGVAPLEGPQSDDSLLFSPRPMGYQNPATVKSIRKTIRQQRERGSSAALLDQLLPMFHPEPTRNPDVIKREREKEAAARQAERRRQMSPAKRKALEHRTRSRAAKKAARKRKPSYSYGGSSSGMYNYGGGSGGGYSYGG